MTQVARGGETYTVSPGDLRILVDSKTLEWALIRDTLTCSVKSSAYPSSAIILPAGSILTVVSFSSDAETVDMISVLIGSRIYDCSKYRVNSKIFNKCWKTLSKVQK
jgi:hypothetical protein